MGGTFHPVRATSPCDEFREVPLWDFEAVPDLIEDIGTQAEEDRDPKGLKVL